MLAQLLLLLYLKRQKKSNNKLYYKSEKCEYFSILAFFAFFVLRLKVYNDLCFYKYILFSKEDKISFAL